MRQHTRGIAAVIAFNALSGTGAGAVLSIGVGSGGSDAVDVSLCSVTVDYEVTAQVGDTNNEGLVGFVMDLAFTDGDVSPVDVPSGDMLNFDRPNGVTGPYGFRGRVVDGLLTQVGGAQNTLLNGRRPCTTDADCASLGVSCGGEFCEPTAPFPIGEVVLGIGHTPVVLATGTVTAPSEPGIYTLTVSNIRATVIRQGEDGSNGYYATEPATIGTITPLTIEVLPIEGVAAASNSGPLCAGDELFLTAEPGGAVAYHWTGPNGLESDEQNPVMVDPADGMYTVTVTDITGCSSQATTTVELLTKSCEFYADCNNNNRNDVCDVLFEFSEDCNRNETPDECELLAAVVESIPPDGAIDARQPSAPSGTDPAGWQSVVLFFDRPIELPRAAEFEVAVSEGEAPAVADVQETEGGVLVELDQPIPPGAWTRITHVPTCNSVCLGYLPADVNGDRLSNSADILRLIDHLNGQVTPTYEIWQCDIDRSGICNSQDVLREIDLLNGAGEYNVWLAAGLPEVCP